MGAIALEARPSTLVGERIPYPLDLKTLPFALTFAQRREVVPLSQRPPTFGTDSDGSTTGNDGSSGGNEEFDWISDD